VHRDLSGGPDAPQHRRANRRAPACGRV